MAFGNLCFRQLKISRLFNASQIALPEETLEHFVSFIRRQFLVIVFVTLVGIALGVVYLVTTPVSYTAQAMLLIDSRKVNLSRFNNSRSWAIFRLIPRRLTARSRS